MSKLPGDMTFSVLFDRSENFKPDAARLSLAGLPIPNASGTTTEYGFVVTGLSDKISLKVDWFKTIVKNASLGETDGNSIAGLGSNAYFIADGMIWGYAGRPPSRTVSAATLETVSRASPRAPTTGTTAQAAATLSAARSTSRRTMPQRPS
jgi:hypothetical protein